MSKIGKAWGKVVSTVKGAARSTKKSVVRTVDVAKQKSAIAHKEKALQDMYVEIGKYVCRSCNDGTLRLNGSGVAGTVEFKDHISEYLILETEFKDEIERMEKMLHWLKNHEVQANASSVSQDASDASDASDAADTDGQDGADADADADADTNADTDANTDTEDKKD